MICHHEEYETGRHDASDHGNDADEPVIATLAEWAELLVVHGGES